MNDAKPSQDHPHLKGQPVQQPFKLVTLLPNDQSCQLYSNTNIQYSNFDPETDLLTKNRVFLSAPIQDRYSSPLSADTLSSESSGTVVGKSKKTKNVNDDKISSNKTQSGYFIERLEALETQLALRVPKRQKESNHNLRIHLSKFKNLEALELRLQSYQPYESSQSDALFSFNDGIKINAKTYMGHQNIKINKLDQLSSQWATDFMIKELIALYFYTIQSSLPILNKAAFEHSPEYQTPGLIYAICAFSVRFSCNVAFLSTNPRFILAQQFFDISRYHIQLNQENPNQSDMQALALLGTLTFGTEPLSFSLFGKSINMGQILDCNYFTRFSKFETGPPKMEKEFDKFSELCRAWMFCLELERISCLSLGKPSLQSLSPIEGGIHIQNLSIPIDLDEIEKAISSLSVSFSAIPIMISKYAILMHHFFFSLRLISQYIVRRGYSTRIKPASSSTESKKLDLLNYIQKLIYTMCKMNPQFPNPKLRGIMKNFTDLARILLNTATIYYFFPETIDPARNHLFSVPFNSSRSTNRIISRCITAAQQTAKIAKDLLDKPEQMMSPLSCFDFSTAVIFLGKLKRSQISGLEFNQDTIESLLFSLKKMSIYWIYGRQCLDAAQAYV